MAENPSHSIDWNVETVKELMNHMAKTGLGELTLEDESFRLTLSARQAVQTVQPVPAVRPRLRRSGQSFLRSRPRRSSPRAR